MTGHQNLGIEGSCQEYSVTLLLPADIKMDYSEDTRLKYREEKHFDICLEYHTSGVDLCRGKKNDPLKDLNAST